MDAQRKRNDGELRQTWHTITFRLRVKTGETAVLADAMAGELEQSARDVHGCAQARVTSYKVDGKGVRL